MIISEYNQTPLIHTYTSIYLAQLSYKNCLLLLLAWESSLPIGLLKLFFQLKTRASTVSLHIVINGVINFLFS